MTATASPLTSGVSAPPCTKAPAPASAPVRAWALLEEGVRLLEALPLEECSVSDVGENLRRMQQHVDRVQAESVGLLADFERRGGPAAQRAPSAVAWLTRECRLNAPEANARLQLARCFDQLPAVTAAVRQGEIGFEHATVLARTAAEVGAATVAPSPQLQAEAARLVERDLLDSARQVDPGRLRQRARQFRNQGDPEGAQDAFLRAHGRRKASWAPSGSSWLRNCRARWRRRPGSTWRALSRRSRSTRRAASACSRGLGATVAAPTSVAVRASTVACSKPISPWRTAAVTAGSWSWQRASWRRALASGALRRHSRVSQATADGARCAAGPPRRSKSASRPTDSAWTRSTCCCMRRRFSPTSETEHSSSRRASSRRTPSSRSAHARTAADSCTGAEVAQGPAAPASGG